MNGRLLSKAVIVTQNHCQYKLDLKTCITQKKNYLSKIHIQLRLFFQLFECFTYVRLLVRPSVSKPPKLASILQELTVTLIFLVIPMQEVFSRKAKVEVKTWDYFL